jgi:L-iditol 2-dehydrogenase
MLARAQGARKVVCVDVNDARLRFAKKQGLVGIIFNSSANPAHPSAVPNDATPAQILAATMEKAKAVATSIRAAAGMKMSDDEGFDVVFECTGAEPCIQAGIYVSSPSFFRRV